MPNKTILHVEDDENDVFFVERAILKASLAVDIRVARDGQQAIDYLGGKGQYGNRGTCPFPDILLLDLKLPLLGGFEVLTWARAKHDLAHLPIYILSSSDNDSDVRRAKQLGANRYFVKSHRFEDLIAELRSSIGH